MRTSRGLFAVTWIFFPFALLASTVACGSGDDDSGQPSSGGKSSSGGSTASGGDSGSGGSDTTGGTGSGGKGGSGATGGTDAAGGSGGTSTGGKGGSGGTGTGGKGGTGGTGGTSGKGGSTASGGSSAGTSSSDLLDAIGEACKADCDQQFALDCAPQNTNTLTCQLSCAASTTQLGDFCLAEYRDYVACRSDGGYNCVSNTPYPKSTCALEQTNFSMCAQHIGCKRYCQRTLDLGCNDTPFDTCLEACTNAASDLPMSCGYQNETVAYCQVTANAMCSGNQLEVPAACSSTLVDIGGCISDDSGEPCDGWCWAADRLGCGGSDCATTCQAKHAPATCGSQWDSLLDCVLFFGDGACSNGELVGNGICDSEMQSYQSCLDAPPM